MQKAHDSSYNDYWKNKPNITTPIVQDQLNRIETTIDTMDDRVVDFDISKANQSDLLSDIKNVTFNPAHLQDRMTQQSSSIRTSRRLLRTLIMMITPRALIIRVLS